MSDKLKLSAPPARQTVYDALSTDPDNGKTARELEDITGVKYATVTEHLRALAEEGLARKEKSGRQITWTRREDVHTNGSGEAVDLTGDRDAASTGARVVDEAAGPAGPVPVREDPEPSETAVAASEALTHTDVPADPGTAATGGVDPADGPTAAMAPAVVSLEAATTTGDVLAAMTAARPLPPASAVAERAPRTRSAGPAREVRNDFGAGGLQGEILSYMDEHRADDGSYKEFGPYELSLALKAHASSVTYSLKRTTKKGQTIRTTPDGVKPRFRLVTAAESAASAKQNADAS